MLLVKTTAKRQIWCELDDVNTVLKTEGWCGGETSPAGKTFEYFYENNAFLSHNFENLRAGGMASGPFPLATSLQISKFWIKHEIQKSLKFDKEWDE